MRSLLPSLLLLLLLPLLLASAGCVHRDNAAVDAFLDTTGTKPAPGGRSVVISHLTDRQSTTSGVNALPTRAITYARADALAYARLWVKFGGQPPRPFGYESRTDAGVLALTAARAHPLTP